MCSAPKPPKVSDTEPRKVEYLYNPILDGSRDDVSYAASKRNGRKDLRIDLKNSSSGSLSIPTNTPNMPTNIPGLPGFPTIPNKPHTATPPRNGNTGLQIQRSARRGLMMR